MREIKFRGKSDITGDWIYGTYIDGFIIEGVIEATNEYITIEKWESVHKYSVGQYTGFNDLDENEIYEGDILRIYDEEDNEDFSWVDDVSFLCGGFFSDDEDLVGNIHFRARVIGNIYENPELLEGRDSEY